MFEDRREVDVLGRPVRSYEPELVLLLLRLRDPDFVDEPSWRALVEGEEPAWEEHGVVDPSQWDPESHVRVLVAQLLARRGDEVTADERRMLDRVSAIEWNCAAWVAQARSLGLELHPWASGSHFEWRVRWRMRSWSRRSGTQSELFDDRRKMLARVADLRADSNLQFFTVDERPVGMWTSNEQQVEFSLDEGD